METKWTLGPWAYDNGRVEAFRGYDKDGAEYWESVAEVEQAVDGPLLASAQDLYAALELALRIIKASDCWWMDEPDRGGFDADAISAALAKARGEA